MPDIDKIPEVKYKATDPYHFSFDNVPLEGILQRQDVMNSAIDNNSQQIRDAIGTEGTINNRISKSLKDNGDLITAAVDTALHSIEKHTDTDDFVRMTSSERDKLDLISDEATSLKLQFNTVSTTPLFEDVTVEFIDSDTTAWALEGSNKIRLDLAFPSTAVRNHFYDLTPVNVNLGVPDYTNYKTTSTNTAFIDDTLRVTINGIRLTDGTGIYVPPSTGPSGTWILTYFSVVDATIGTFSFNRALDPSDIIRIDFDSEF